VKGFKIGIVFLLVFMYGTVFAEVVDKIVARVNDEIITLSDLNHAFESYRKRVEESYKGPDLTKAMAEARRFVLDRMIEQTLVEQQAKKAGISVKDEEVMDSINDYLARRKITMQDLLKSLARDGSSIEEYKKDTRTQITTMTLIRREIKSKIMITEEELGAFYLKHREDYEGKEAVRIQQILVPFPENVDPAAKATLKNEADELYKRLAAGESFDTLAARYSHGPAAGAGGDVGFVERGMIFPAVEKVAFSLKKDEISPVIESPIGFHIVKLIDRRGAGIMPLESVRVEIQAKIENEKMEKKYVEWIAELRSKSHIDMNL
jgi:peptidyl-prolyl cis-trans isomerase SurA